MRDNFFLTDLKKGCNITTIMLTDRRIPLFQLFRAHRPGTSMARNALLADISMATSSGQGQGQQPRKIIRLCNTQTSLARSSSAVVADA